MSDAHKSPDEGDVTRNSSAFVDRATARRLELSSAWRSVRYSEAYARLHPDAGSTVLPTGGGYAVFTGLRSPVNSAIGLGFDGPVTDADLKVLENFYHAHGLAAKVHVCPLADESLFALVKERGYRLSHFFSVLYRPLEEAWYPERSASERFVTAAGPEQAELWLRVTGQGFEESETPSSATLEVLGPNFYAEDGRAYLAWIDGEPAGGGGMYYNLEQRGVELGGASTRPAFRRRGVQRALIEARLADARALGCDVALVLTEPGSDSQRNLARAGFRLAYTKVVMEK